MMVNAFNEQMSTEDTNALLTELSVYLAGSSSCPEILDLLGAIQEGRYHEVVDSTPDYTNLRVHDAIIIRQLAGFFSKRDDLDLGIDRRAVALEKWSVSEQQCKLTNESFMSWRRGEFSFPSRVESVLFRAQRKIAHVLGEVPRLAQLRCYFGPGATTTVKKKNATALTKFRGGFVCSANLVSGIEELLNEVPGWTYAADFGLVGPSPEYRLVPVEVGLSRLVCVPKDAKTDRTIAIEPVMNSFFQNGIGDYMARRLRRFGIDITDQTRNQRMARYGSITGDVATLDLSSASDTLATELIHHLLPLDWFLFLDRFRSRSVDFGGSEVQLQKFSSMGNGFTFPLETLIFWALASSCLENDFWCSVYGDDIIVPARSVDLVRETLRCCGFTLNEKKSFWSGPFRESCGKDYLSGIDIRPKYIRTKLSGESLFELHNFFVRNYDEGAAEIVLAAIGEPMRIWGPDGYGDGHLIGKNLLSPKNRDKGWGGFVFETYVWSRRSFRCHLKPGDAMLPLYSIYIGASKDAPLGLSNGACINVLPGKGKYKRISVYTLEHS